MQDECNTETKAETGVQKTHLNDTIYTYEYRFQPGRAVTWQLQHISDVEGTGKYERICRPLTRDEKCRYTHDRQMTKHTDETIIDVMDCLHPLPLHCHQEPNTTKITLVLTDGLHVRERMKTAARSNSEA